MNKKVITNYLIIAGMLLVLLASISCSKQNDDSPQNISDDIKIDSLIATHHTVKAWDTTTITCHASGTKLTYTWECDHGNFNGGGDQIKYAAGECCVGINTITCKVSNESGYVSENIAIEVTSYFGGGK
ncbi:MAG: hypothetical protein U5Q03_04975 [Bacteroidota bacterium]|nr:hypothetical protein [Bacteroidota bacterium]